MKSLEELQSELQVVAVEIRALHVLLDKAPGDMKLRRKLSDLQWQAKFYLEMIQNTKGG